MSKITKISENGITMIKQFEGCRLEAYKDTAGIRTIGYGHAYYKGDSPITKYQAEQLLIADLAGFELKVIKYDKIYHWNQNEFDAMVSFAYNVGDINQLTNNGSRTKDVIAQKMLLYNKSGGKYIKGMEDRRKKEREVFLNGYGNTPNPEDKASVKDLSYDLIFNIIDGVYGNGETRKIAINAMGLDYRTVQDAVNVTLKLIPVADAVIMGDYGNGEKRKENLKKQGYDYNKVQKLVNYMLKHRR